MTSKCYLRPSKKLLSSLSVKPKAELHSRAPSSGLLSFDVIKTFAIKTLEQFSLYEDIVPLFVFFPYYTFFSALSFRLFYYSLLVAVPPQRPTGKNLVAGRHSINYPWPSRVENISKVYILLLLS